MNKYTYFYTSYKAVRENKPGSSSGAGAADFDPVEVCPLLYCIKMLIELEEWDLVMKVLDSLLNFFELWVISGNQ